MPSPRWGTDRRQPGYVLEEGTVNRKERGTSTDNRKKKRGGGSVGAICGKHFSKQGGGVGARNSVELSWGVGKAAHVESNPTVGEGREKESEDKGGDKRKRR